MPIRRGGRKGPGTIANTSAKLRSLYYDREGRTIGGTSGGGTLRVSMNDRNLVGSRNQITEFDGEEYGGGESGGFEGGEGGGGGTGSSLAGRESVGNADLNAGSVQDVVYGVRQRNKRGRRAKGE